MAHELDAEIQEELYGHMEDKLLGYLSGEERLSEQDAFVLVRDAHPIEARVSLVSPIPAK